MISLKAELSGANEVPPNDRPATGMATLTFDSDSKTLSWKIVFENLSGPLIGAHIHGPANTSGNAGILLPMNEEQDPIEGETTLVEEQAKHLLNGDTYLNLHTEAHPGGEIRGQITK